MDDIITKEDADDIRDEMDLIEYEEELEIYRTQGYRAWRKYMGY